MMWPGECRATKSRPHERQTSFQGGIQPAGAAELHKARQECQRLQRQCDRQQALLRLQQRALGLGTPPARARGPDSNKGGKKRRRPRQRTLRLIEDLRQGPADGTASVAAPAEG